MQLLSASTSSIS